MKKSSLFLRLLSAGTLLFGVVACIKDVDPQTASLYSNGVLVLNAGNFLDNNGSLSFIRNNATSAETDLFQVRNKRPLTGGLSDYLEVGSKGLILVDNSSAGMDKIEIVKADSLRSLATLAAPDIENPRAAVRVSDTKAYVTCWGATGTFPNFYTNPGYIAVIDLSTNKISKKIPLLKGTENIVIVGSEAFVSGAGDEKLVQVVNTQTDAVTGSIALPAPASRLVVDANNKIWTLIGGNAVRINPDTKAIEATIKVGTSTQKSPGTLTPGADRRTMYFLYTFYDAADNYRQKGELYSFNIADTSIPADKPLVSRVFSGLGVDPQGVIYAGLTPSYKQAGYVLRYRPTGQVIDSVRAEIAPTKFYFK